MTDKEKVLKELNEKLKDLLFELDDIELDVEDNEQEMSVTTQIRTNFLSVIGNSKENEETKKIQTNAVNQVFDIINLALAITNSSAFKKGGIVAQDNNNMSEYIINKTTIKQ